MLVVNEVCLHLVSVVSQSAWLLHSSCMSARTCSASQSTSLDILQASCTCSQPIDDQCHQNTTPLPPQESQEASIKLLAGEGYKQMIKFNFLSIFLATHRHGRKICQEIVHQNCVHSIPGKHAPHYRVYCAPIHQHSK